LTLIKFRVPLPLGRVIPPLEGAAMAFLDASPVPKAGARN
jgi:hypothetical protein